MAAGRLLPRAAGLLLHGVCARNARRKIRFAIRIPDPRHASRSRLRTVLASRVFPKSSAARPLLWRSAAGRRETCSTGWRPHPLKESARCRRPRKSRGVARRATHHAAPRASHPSSPHHPARTFTARGRWSSCSRPWSAGRQLPRRNCRAWQLGVRHHRLPAVGDLGRRRLWCPAGRAHHRQRPRGDRAREHHRDPARQCAHLCGAVLQGPGALHWHVDGHGAVDVPTPLTTYEWNVVGNRVAEVYIAGLIYVSQQGLNQGAGFINFIDYNLGEIRVGGLIGSNTTGTRVRLNDPVGRYGRPTTSPDVRFTVDPDNPTIMAGTGYPMCLPRTAPCGPGVSTDGLCPEENRPIQAILGDGTSGTRRHSPRTTARTWRFPWFPGSRTRPSRPPWKSVTTLPTRGRSSRTARRARAAVPLPDRGPRAEHRLPGSRTLAIFTVAATIPPTPKGL